MLGLGKARKLEFELARYLKNLRSTQHYTGTPKMVAHTHGSYGYCHWVTGKYWLDLRPTDLHWNISDTG